MLRIFLTSRQLLFPLWTADRISGLGSVVLSGVPPIPGIGIGMGPIPVSLWIPVSVSV